MDDRMRAVREQHQRMQDRHERGQSAVADQLWDTEQALSNRVRIFAAAVLAVSWGLVLEPRGFDLRILLAACVLAMISLMLDFGYFLARRQALHVAYRKGIHAFGGAGVFARVASVAGVLRSVLFLAATVTLTYAALDALLPQLAASAS